MVFLAFIWLILSAVTAACYNIFLKKSPEKLLLSFWVAVFTFVGMTIVFYESKLISGASLEAITKNFGVMAIENIYNYLLVGGIVVLGIALKAYLFHHYSLAKIIPILEIGTPLTALLYFFLGNHLTFQETLSIGLISAGAFVSGFERFHFPNIFKPLLRLPFYLYVGALTMALLDTSENLIVYLTTEANETTHKVVHFFHTHGITFFTKEFITSLEYFQVSSLFFVVIFLLYLMVAAKKKPHAIMKELYTQKTGIFYASVANFLSQYLYYYVYQNNDQAVVVALTKFSVPLTLSFAYLTLKEEIHAPEIVGVVLILVGGCIGAL